MTQPEALRLADRLTMHDYYEFDAALHCPSAAAELRRLHAVNQELLAALEKLARLGNGERYGISAVVHTGCCCAACINGNIHDSDCSVHNGDALPKGPCDCSAAIAKAEGGAA